ncbi:Golgi-associated plant pathogenesis-related protein 1-like [Montipora foliosa]|uniref:Golgi-associated plant pathogenesis-related protein 1-like n=1 Tax=Montipora foliosa TaxID=591990 RepID=UPI0035F21898
MQSYLIVLSFSISIAWQAAVTKATLPFKEQCVKWHNEFRARHQVGPVSWDPSLAKDAAKWATYLAANNLFQHERNINQGENLYRGSKKPTEPCTVATKLFYDEIKYYDFNKPGFSPKTGHFTQVVWKKSKRIGAAYATGNDGSVVVVIRYSPPGNYVGEAQFRNNVFPAKEEKQESGNQLSPLEENGGQTSCSCGIISLVIFAIITIRLCH